MKLPRSVFANGTPRQLTSEEIVELAGQVGLIDGIGLISPETTSVQTLPLPWLPSHHLILASDPLWHPVGAAWVRGADGNLTRLDGTSPPIHTLNHETAPKFTGDNIIQYISFFCSFVHGDEGPFFFVSPDDLGSLPDELDKDYIASLAREPQLLKVVAKEDGTSEFYVEASLMYSNAMFLSNFVITQQGFVEMLEDEPLAQELAVSIMMPLKFTSEALSVEAAVEN